MANVQMDIRDLTPKFLDFYEVAIRENADEERRWQIWQELYNFAAVPPTEEGMSIARNLLNEAWPKYPSIIHELRTKFEKSDSLKASLEQVATELQCDKDIHVIAVLFVGGFDNNAFATHSADGRPVVCFPVEMEQSKWDIMLAHEFTHIVHAMMSNFETGWNRSVEVLLLQEGLAIHTSKKIVPGYSEESYIEHREDWLNQCCQKEKEILKAICEDIVSELEDNVFKLTMGTGNCGIEREGYYVGYKVVEKLLDSGWSLGQIASVKKEQMKELVLQSIDDILHE